MQETDNYWKIQLICLAFLVALFSVIHFGVFTRTEVMGDISAEAVLCID